MRLYTEDEKCIVDVGTGSIWYSIYSTAYIAFSEENKKSVSLAMEFLKTGECPAENVAETKIQLMRLQNAFEELSPDKAVYDLHRPDVAPPWDGNIAPTVTSCANLYTTADGKDLFTEVLNLLDYAASQNAAVTAG